jgi:hypothetical protein
VSKSSQHFDPEQALRRLVDSAKRMLLENEAVLDRLRAKLRYDAMIGRDAPQDADEERAG